MRQTIIYYSAAREENASSTPPVVHDFTTLDTSKNIFIAEIVCQKDFSYLKNMKNLCIWIAPTLEHFGVGGGDFSSRLRL